MPQHRGGNIKPTNHLPDGLLFLVHAAVRGLLLPLAKLEGALLLVFVLLDGTKKAVTATKMENGVITLDGGRRTPRASPDRHNASGRRNQREKRASLSPNKLTEKLIHQRATRFSNVLDARWVMREDRCVLQRSPGQTDSHKLTSLSYSASALLAFLAPAFLLATSVSSSSSSSPSPLLPLTTARSPKRVARHGRDVSMMMTKADNKNGG